ncbi:MAG TPA: hypothetical protein VMT20_10165 [Terriglobia bacterium]|nr:hypothetical protein [Terriglobia bacterium]
MTRLLHLPTLPGCALIVLVVAVVPCLAEASGQAVQNVPDMSGEYEFTQADDTLGLLEEEGKLKGYIDVAQGADESDEVLTYQIIVGTRQGNHVEFKTNKIHEKYYHFTGTVERGGGHTERDPDFLRLVGDLESVKLDSDTGQEHIERRRETFRWKGKSK